MIFCLFFCQAIFATTIVTLDPPQVLQGNCLTLKLKTTLPFSSSNIYFDNHFYNLYKISSGNYKIILGTTYESAPGSRNVYVHLYQNKKIVFNQRYIVKIQKSKFRLTNIMVAPAEEKKGATNWVTLAKENNILGKAFKRQTQQCYFQDSFSLPCTYNVISSEYGVQRKYFLNKKIISEWAHRGIDFVNEIGTPVRAINNGIVVVAQPMTVHGNTIVIDHGQGILSIYNHMSKLYVKPGELIKKKQLIGRVGVTGLVTGAHLHLGISVNNVRVNPLEWFKKKF